MALGVGASRIGQSLLRHLDGSRTKTTGVNQQELMIWFNEQGGVQPISYSYDSQGVAVPIATINVDDTMIRTPDFAEPVTDAWYRTSMQAGFEPGVAAWA